MKNKYNNILIYYKYIMKIYDHIIIGSGLSGLYIGYNLQKNNSDFLIFEKN